MKKKIAIFMAATMVMSTIPMSVFAASESRINKIWRATASTYDDESILRILLKDDATTGEAFSLTLDNDAVWQEKDPEGIAKELLVVEKWYETPPALSTVTEVDDEIGVQEGVVTAQQTIISDANSTDTEITDAQYAKAKAIKTKSALIKYKNILQEGNKELVVKIDGTEVDGTTHTKEVDGNELKITFGADVPKDTEIEVKLVITPEKGNTDSVSVTINPGSSIISEARHKIIEGNKAGIIIESDGKSKVIFKEKLVGSFEENGDDDIVVTLLGSKAKFQKGNVLIEDGKNLVNGSVEVEVTPEGKTDKTITIKKMDIMQSTDGAFKAQFGLNFADVITINDRDFEGTISANVEGLGGDRTRVVIYDSGKFVEIVELTVDDEIMESDSSRVEVEGSEVILTESVDGGFTGRYIKLQLTKGATWSADEDDVVMTEFKLGNGVVRGSVDENDASILYIDNMKAVDNDEVDELKFIPIVDVDGNMDGKVSVTVSGPGVVLKGNKSKAEAVVLEVRAPISLEANVVQVRAGQTNNKTSDIVIKENHAGALTIGEYKLSIDTGSIDSKTIKLNGVSEKKSGTDGKSGLVIENVALSSEKDSNSNYILFDITEVSEGKAGTITISNLVVFTDGTVPTSDEIYKVTLENSSTTNEDAISISTSTNYLVVSNLVEDKVSGLNRDVTFTIGSNTVSVDGELVGESNPPYINSNGSTMIPVRALSEALGLRKSDIVWNPIDKTVTLFLSKGKVVRFKSGTSEVLINGTSVPLVNSTSGLVDRAENINGTTHLPLRFIAERVFDVEVEWDGTTRTAIFNPSR